MDLLEHAAGVWSRRLLVLAVGLAVAAAVFVWRSSAPEEYAAETTVQVRLPESTSSDLALQVTYYAENVVGLATTRSVLERALENAGLPSDADAVDEATADVAAASTARPGFATISATGRSGQEAANLADALAEVVAEEVATDQADDRDARSAAITEAIAEVGRQRREVLDDTFALAALERERESLLNELRTAAAQPTWRLAVVEPAEVPDAPEAPRPLRDALLALVIALVLAAEGVVLVRAIRGSLSVRDPARDVTRTTGLPAVAVGPDDGPTALGGVLATVSDEHTVSVVQLGSPPRARTAAMLARLLAARGEDVLLADTTARSAAVHLELGIGRIPGLTDLDPATSAEDLEQLQLVDGIWVLPAGRPSSGGIPAVLVDRVVEVAPQSHLVLAASAQHADDLLDVAAALAAPTVLVLDAGTTRKQLQQAVTAVRGLGLDVVAVVVERGNDRGARRTPAAELAQA